MNKEVKFPGNTNQKSARLSIVADENKVDPIRLSPEPSDPLAGLINSQGLPVLHFSYVLVNWLYLDFCLEDTETKVNCCMF